jgi:hypothetical protein
MATKAALPGAAEEDVVTDPAMLTIAVACDDEMMEGRVSNEARREREVTRCR